MSLGIWLANQVLSIAQKKAIEHFTKQTLLHRLHAKSEHWSQELPSTAFLANIDAIFAPKTEVSDESPPAVRLVIAKLETFEIPTAEDWAEDLLVQWNWVRKNVPERQPFFNLSESEARQYLLDLAKQLELECKQDPACFQVTALDELAAIKQTQSQVLSRLEAIAGDNTFPQQITIQIVSQTPDASSSSGFHAEVDAAAAFLNKHQPDIAIAQLEQLEKRHWDVSPDRVRFRVKANLGHAYLAKNDLRAAGRFFIEAKQFQPADEQARTLEAIGHSLLGDSAKAFELATSILKDFSQSDLANATWVRNAPQAMSFDNVESFVPKEVREQAETASALAWRALQGGQPAAAVSYARAAFSRDPAHVGLTELLGIVLLHFVCIETTGQFSDTPQIQNPHMLNEANQLLTTALQHIPEGLPNRRAMLRFHLGRIESLLGNPTKAEAHFLYAWEQKRDDAEYARQYALCLRERHDIANAIQTLEEALSTDDSAKNALLLADTWIGRDESGDKERALELLNAYLPKLSSFEISERFEIVNTMLFILWSQSEKERATKLLAEITPVEATPFIHALLSSIAKRRFGDKDGSVTDARTALEQLPPDAPPVLRRILALQLDRVELHSESLMIWKSIVHPTFLGFDTVDVLRLAAKCQDVLFVQEFCRELRRNGLIDRDAVHLEVDILQEHNCFDSAINAMREILSGSAHDSLKKEVRVRLSHLGLAIGRPEVITFEPSQLPAVTETEPLLGMATVEVLSKGPDPAAAVRYAYELVRRHFDSDLAHRAMVISVFGRQGDKSELDDPQVVAPGTAVKFREADAPADQWIIIEDGPEPDSARDEYLPTHGLARALLGKHQGDEFQLRADPLHPRVATIVEIWSKYKFRFNRCVEEWEHRFPEKFFLWQFRLKQDQDGQPQVDDVLRSVDERIEAIKARDELYRQNPLSTTSYARLTEVSVLDAIRHLSGQAKLPIRCCAGNDAEKSIASNVLRNSRPLMLDGTALATLFLTDAYRLLPKLPMKLAISQGTLLEWRRALIAAERIPADGGFLTKHNKKYVYFENDPEQLKKYCTALRDFLEVISQTMLVHEGMALAHIERNQRRQLIEFLGRSAAETIAIAIEQGYAIWTDDRWVGEIAVNDHQLQRVWTAATMIWASERTIITFDERSRIIVQLLKLGYFYTPIELCDFEWAGKTDSWSPSGPSLSACLDWLANPHTKPAGILNCGLHAMAVTYRAAGSEFARTTIVTQIISKIRQRPDGFGILQKLRDMIDVVTGHDQVMAADLRGILDGWIDISRQFYP